MRRLATISAVVALGLSLSADAALAAQTEGAQTYGGPYNGARFFCGTRDVTDDVGSTAGGNWVLNRTPSGAQIVSVLFIDGRLHATVPWTGSFQLTPAADHDPGSGFLHYGRSLPAGDVDATLDVTSGRWTYRVRLADAPCSGPAPTATYDVGVFTGVWRGERSR